MYGSTKPVYTSYNGKYDEYDVLSYMQAPEWTKSTLLHCHKHNVATVSTALWRLIPASYMPVVRHYPYDVGVDTRMFVVSASNLFPGIDDPKIARWWLKNVEKTGINYSNAIGTISRRFGLMLPVVSNMTVTEVHIELFTKFSLLLGYENSKSLLTQFAFHVPYELLQGGTLREKGETLVSAIKERHLRRRISVIGSNVSDLVRLSKSVGTSVTVDYDVYSAELKTPRVDCGLYAEAAQTWTTPGSTARGMLLTRETKEKRLRKLLPHFEKNRFSTIILDG